MVFGGFDSHPRHSPKKGQKTRSCGGASTPWNSGRSAKARNEKTTRENKMNKTKMGNRMRIVYLVTGTEDGILGVYSSKKGAYNEALNYVNDCREGREVISLEKVRRELKGLYNHQIELCEYNSGLNASIYAVKFNCLEIRHFIPLLMKQYKGN